jgi:bacterioferritin-associated ferredoxin
MLGMIVLRIVPISKRIRITFFGPEAMYICICNAVTDREIRGAVSLGCRTVGDLKRDLGVASCCGKCELDARRVIRECTRACVADAPAARAFAAGD